MNLYIHTPLRAKRDQWNTGACSSSINNIRVHFTIRVPKIHGTTLLLASGMYNMPAETRVAADRSRHVIMSCLIDMGLYFRDSGAVERIRSAISIRIRASCSRDSLMELCLLGSFLRQRC